AAFIVKGSAEALQLSAGQLAITASDLAVKIGPLSGVVHPGKEFRLSELVAPVLIDISDTAALSQYNHLPMPVLGPVRIGGRLAQQGKAFQLLDITAAIGEGKPAAEITGRIGNLATLSDASFSGKIRYVDSGTLLATLVPGFSYRASLGGLDGTFKLTEQKGKWTLSDLALAAGDETTPLAFTLKGRVSDLSGLPSIDLDATFRLADPALLQAVSGRALKPLSGSLVVATTPGEIHGTLNALVGDTEISGDTSVQLGDKQVEGIKIALETPLLKLQDFGFFPAKLEDTSVTDTPAAIDAANEPAVLEGTTQGASPEPQPGPALLAQLRENSPAFPIDVSIRIEGFSGDSSNLDKLQLRVSGSGRRYTLQQLSAGYNQALAEIRGIIDLNPTPPALSLSAQATALPLGAILRDVGITANVTGALTILGGVTVMGETAEAMVGSMNGSVALALEKAVLKGAAYDLLATDLLAWIYTGALTEESTQLDCAMAKFALQNGVATTENLFIESTKMVASGSAKFDLVKRRMDLRLTPLSKSRLLQVPSRIRLKGDMSKPKAEISPVAAVADATSSALMLIPELTLKLFGVNRGAKRDFRPCQAEIGN
ncbi:MAG: AsmA family protein, partial [Halioglobus sp.]|nr:AsmA family protein [Halioglobus sp.]